MKDATPLAPRERQAKKETTSGSIQYK